MRLLYAVEEHPGGPGFGWCGPIMRAGEEVDPATLWPDPRFPRLPVMLECAGRTKGCARGERLFVLWQLRAGQWKDLLTCRATSYEWAVAFRPLAAELLQPPPDQDEPAPDYKGLCLKATDFIDALLQTGGVGGLPLSKKWRWAFLSFLQEELAVQIAAGCPPHKRVVDIEGRPGTK